jgi:hypothetical protein
MDGPDNNGSSGGPVSVSGVNATLIHQVFHLTRSLARSGEGAYAIRLAVVEIYNEAVRDLLAVDGAAGPAADGTNGASDSNNNNKLKVSHQGAGIAAMAGLTWQSCDSISQVNLALKRGKSNRATAGTNLNEHSSRSHSVVIVEVRGQHGESANPSAPTTTTLQDDASATGAGGAGATTVGYLYLVDLAGSERVNNSKVTGERLDETKAINKSLSALGDVLQALDKKSKHVPYRNSKLTHILQPALGANARTVMILTVPPSASSANETLNSLKFAQRVRNIELGPAQKRIEAKSNRAAEAQVRDNLRQATARIAKLELDLTHTRSALESAEKKLATIKAQGLRSKGAGGAQAHQQARLNDALNREMSELRSKHMALRQRTKEDAMEHERERNQLFSELKATRHAVTEAKRVEADLMHKVRVLQKDLTRAHAAAGGGGGGGGGGTSNGYGHAAAESSGGKRRPRTSSVASSRTSLGRDASDPRFAEWAEEEPASSSISRRLGLQRTPMRGGGGYTADTVGSANKRRMSVGSAVSGGGGGGASVASSSGSNSRRAGRRRRPVLDDDSVEGSTPQRAKYDSYGDAAVEEEEHETSPNDVPTSTSVFANANACKSPASVSTTTSFENDDEADDSRSEASRHQQGQGQRSGSGSGAALGSTSSSARMRRQSSSVGRLSLSSRTSTRSSANANASAPPRFLQAGSGAARLKHKSDAALAAKKGSTRYSVKQQQQRSASEAAAGGTTTAAVGVVAGKSKIPASFANAVAKAKLGGGAVFASPSRSSGSAEAAGAAGAAGTTSEFSPATRSRLRAPGFVKRNSISRSEE